MDYLSNAKKLLSGTSKNERPSIPSSHSSHSNPTHSKNTTALDLAVSNLVKAAIGGEAKELSDAELDKYVMDLILKEADSSNKRYKDSGISAFLDTSTSKPQ